MPYVLIDKCPTHVLRTKLATFNIECKNKRRNELISLLKSRGVLILEAQNVSESHSTKSFIMCSNPSYSDIPHGDCLTTSSVDRNDDWVLIDGSKSVDYESPTKVPIETLAKRPTPKYSDARFTDVTVLNNLEIGENLFVNSVNMTKEIADVKVLKDSVEQNMSDLNGSVQVMRNVIESFPNKQLSVYNIASEISYSNYKDMISPSSIFIEDASFFGRLEDSTVHLDLQFTISNIFPYDEFTLDLPYEIDGILNVIPATVVVYFNFNEDDKTWGSKSFISQAYINSNISKNKLFIHSTLFKDPLVPLNKFKIFVNLKYFSKLDEDTLSPVRFSSLHYIEEQQIIHDTIDVKWQWTVLDNRIQLLGNFVVSSPSTQTIEVQLPVIASMVPAMDIIGYGRISYGIDPLGVDVFASNTPLVMISKQKPDKLQVISMLFSNDSNVYHISTHITYMKNYENEIISITFDRMYYQPGSVIKMSFKTRTPINSFYLSEITLFSPWSPVSGEIIADKLYGSQKRWFIDIPVPTDTTAGMVFVSIRLHHIEYSMDTASFVDVSGVSDIHLFKVSKIETNALELILGDLEDDTNMPHTVQVQAKRKTNGIVDYDNIVSSTFSTDSDSLIVNVNNLVDNTEYKIIVTLTDQFNRVTVFEHPIIHTTVNIVEPTFYDTKQVVRNNHILVSGNINFDVPLYWRLWATTSPVSSYDWIGYLDDYKNWSLENNVISGNVGQLNEGIFEVFHGTNTLSISDETVSTVYVNLLAVNGDPPTHSFYTSDEIRINKIVSSQSDLFYSNVDDITFHVSTLYETNVSDFLVNKVQIGAYTYTCDVRRNDATSFTFTMNNKESLYPEQSNIVLFNAGLLNSSHQNVNSLYSPSVFSSIYIEFDQFRYNSASANIKEFSVDNNMLHDIVFVIQPIGDSTKPNIEIVRENFISKNNFVKSVPIENLWPNTTYKTECHITDQLNRTVKYIGNEITTTNVPSINEVTLSQDIDTIIVTSEIYTNDSIGDLGNIKWYSVAFPIVVNDESVITNAAYNIDNASVYCNGIIDTIVNIDTFFSFAKVHVYTFFKYGKNSLYMSNIVHKEIDIVGIKESSIYSNTLYYTVDNTIVFHLTTLQKSQVSDFSNITVSINDNALDVHEYEISFGSNDQRFWNFEISNIQTNDTGFINMSLIFNETKSSTDNIYIYDITTIQNIQVYVLNNEHGTYLVISNINDDSEIPHTLTICRLEQENLTLGTYGNVTKNSTIQLALSDYDAKYDVFKICMTDALNRTKCFYFPDIQIGILRIKNITYTYDLTNYEYKISFDMHSFIYKDDSSHLVDFYVNDVKVFMVQHNRTSSRYTIDDIVVPNHGLQVLNALITNLSNNKSDTVNLGEIFIPEYRMDV